MLDELNMMKDTGIDIKFKMILINQSNSYNIPEFHLKKNQVYSDSDFIIKISELLEYIITGSFEYIIIDNRDNSYKIGMPIINFLNEMIIDQRLSYNIRKVFILSDKPHHGKQRQGGVEFCSNFEEIKKSIFRQ
jgi:hypothetical protein